MPIKQLITCTLTTLLLTACNTLPTTAVTDRDLLRSMVYTQQHLIEMELGTQPIADTNRHALLLQSHCDLIHRDFVYARSASAQCPLPTNNKMQLCMANFHRCIGQCPTFKRQCLPCEQQAQQCLKPTG